MRFSNFFGACLQSLRSLWGNTPYIIHEVGPMLGSGLAEQTRALLQGIIDNFAAAGDTNQTVVVLPYDDGSSGYGELQCHHLGACSGASRQLGTWLAAMQCY